MKKLLILFAFLGFFNALSPAKPISQETAMQVALNFFATQGGSERTLTAENLTLSYRAEYRSPKAEGLTGMLEGVYFYVFNEETSGFVMVSGDDAITPILGYSHEGIFQPDNMPVQVKKWLEEYKVQIRLLVENQTEATEEIALEWASYLNGSTNKATGATAAVNPLLSTKWDQSPYYNSMCPGGSVTGCVATAMAQIMKFWNYPQTGSGFHSYNHRNYGTISANFGSTTYNWSSMPNQLSGSNSAVATLMYHCGVSVDMDYSPQVSGAYVISDMSPVKHCSEYALKTYFGYKSSMKGEQRINYSRDNWISLLKSELDAGRPILYAGFGSGGGHAFVCDGYDNNSYFHFNWGWGGAYDGYFWINTLDPSGTGTGGGSGGYNSGHQALIGIEAPSKSQNVDMALYDDVSPSSSVIGYGEAFSVSTNISNYGTTTFNGDYCAAIFDDQNNFIDFVEVLQGYSLQGGYAYTNNLRFSSSGLFSMLPGTYQIGIFYRPGGENWVLVRNNGSYKNLVQIEVYYANDIELNSAITVNPASTLIQGEGISVNLNIVNDGSSTFTGQYVVGLYNLDGTHAQTIEVMNETGGLPSGYTYKSPFLTFSNSSVNVKPGTYLLAVQHNPNNQGWQLTGSSYFQNPIYVTVREPAPQPDRYEVNDALTQAFNLPLAFSGNTASLNSDGSSLHVGTDNDYYKIVLPGGYEYSITARLHDSYNSGNGTTYTADALFSYSLDGVNWSEAFDDLMSSKLEWVQTGTLYVHVAPFFAGETGTYLLDLDVVRKVAVGIPDQKQDEFIQIFPNPASDQIIINYQGLQNPVNQIQLVHVSGALMRSLAVPETEHSARLTVQDLPTGLYVVLLHTAEGLIQRKVIIQ